MSVSLRFHTAVTSIPHRYHFGFTSIPLWCHSEFTSVSLRCHFDFTSMSIRLHFESTSKSRRFRSGLCHFNFISTSLRFHMEKRGTPCHTREKGKFGVPKGKRESPVPSIWARLPPGNQTARTHERNETISWSESPAQPPMDINGYPHMS